MSEILLVNRRIDTLYINVYGNMPEAIAEMLDRLRQTAQDTELDAASVWDFLGDTLYVKSHGSERHWRWIAQTGSRSLHMEMGYGKRNHLIAKARLSSLLLHEIDEGEALNRLHLFLIQLFGEHITLQAQSVDLCADVVGWYPTLLDADYFVTRSINQAMRYDSVEEPEFEIASAGVARRKGRRLTGYDFSKGAPHFCRIYDKTQEVKDHHKEWFHEVWKANGWNGTDPVMRIEFSYGRQCLHEMGIEDPYDMLDHLPGLWAYSTKHWLRHTVPSGDGNQTRWPLSEFWKVVQTADFNGDPTPVVRQRKYELDVQRVAAGAVGYITSWAARTDMSLDAMEDGAGFLVLAFDWMRERLEEKQLSFTSIVKDKAQRIGRTMADY